MAQNILRTAAATVSSLVLLQSALAADFTCNGLVPSGQKMICAGFEPNWAIELACHGDTMGSVFVDAFSGNEITRTEGQVVFQSESPWAFETEHPVTGAIAYTPAGCTDEGDNVHDFTFTPTGAPGLSGPFFPFCCRLENAE